MEKRSRGPSHPALGKQEIAERLRLASAMLRFRGESLYRARAYENGAAAIEASAEALDQLIDEGKLGELPGIGRSLAATISELALHGRAESLERIMDDQLPPALLALVDVPGFTARRIRLLHESLDVASPDEVRAALESGAVARLRGFGAVTAQKLLAALSQPAAAVAPLTRLAEATTWARRLAAYLRSVAGTRGVEIAGSVRRAVETVRDVNLVACSLQPAALLAGFTRYPGSAPLAGATGSRSAIQLIGGPSVTLEVSGPERFGVALLRATGSAAHVAALERRARSRGLILDDLPGEDEEEVYRAVGLPYVPPELREDRGELESAEDGDDFGDLVTAADLRGAVHCHSTYSDGADTIANMASEAARRGLEYLTMTDHSPAAAYAHGMPLERLAEQSREIEGIGRSLGVRIFRGAECDILRDGALDYADDVRARLDVVIASIHERFRMDQAAMTTRLTKALGDRRFKIWGHPLGRLLLRRPPIACDLDVVLDVLSDAGGAIELNGSPWRLDLPADLIPRARARRLKFVISADAHSTRELGYLEWGVAMARRGGLRRHDVLNTLDAEGFAAAVR